LIKTWAGKDSSTPAKTERGPIEPFNDRLALRHEISKRKREQWRRDQRVRPEDDWYPQEVGERLLSYAKEYRKDHPNATLSEVADALEAYDNVFDKSLRGANSSEQGKV